MFMYMKETNKENICKKIKEEEKDKIIISYNRNSGGAQRHKPTLNVYLFKTIEEPFFFGRSREKMRGLRESVSFIRLWSAGSQKIGRTPFIPQVRLKVLDTSSSKFDLYQYHIMITSFCQSI